MLTLPGLLSLVVGLVFLGLVFYLLSWLLDQIPLPTPIRVVVRVLLALILIILLLNTMFGVMPVPLLVWPRR